jgi:hypothetical protein
MPSNATFVLCPAASAGASRWRHCSRNDRDFFFSMSLPGPAAELLTAERLSKIYGVALKTLAAGEELFFVPD